MNDCKQKMKQKFKKKIPIDENPLNSGIFRKSKKWSLF